MYRKKNIFSRDFSSMITIYFLFFSVLLPIEETSYLCYNIALEHIFYPFIFQEENTYAATYLFMKEDCYGNQKNKAGRNRCAA